MSDAAAVAAGAGASQKPRNNYFPYPRHIQIRREKGDVNWKAALGLACLFLVLVVIAVVSFFAVQAAKEA